MPAWPGRPSVGQTEVPVSQVIAAERPEPLRVVIAGGGVAALEGMLALRALAGAAVAIDLLAPEAEFVYSPTSVAEPFGLSDRRAYDLARIARDHGARLVRDSLAAVDSERRTAITGGGAEIEYDALLIAVGAQRVEAVPGALTFRGPADVARFRELLDRLTSDAVERVAFVVPREVRWPLAVYELALLTAAHLTAGRAAGVQVVLVTHEPAPLGLFGRRASDSVAQVLERAGVAVRTGCFAEGVEGGRLRMTGAGDLIADAVVALPKLHVPELPGVPQSAEGFIATNDYGGVDGLFRVYAAGDATWFPIKQGGAAAQQADVAATSIAACAGAGVKPARLAPVLRGLLLTGGAPHYLRSVVGERDATSAAGPDPLWWPPGKIAARYLAPYLSSHDELSAPLEDLEAVAGEPGRRGAEHNAVLEMALAAADADARWGDHAGALRWLDVAEQLNVVLPPEYAGKRRRWASASPARPSAARG